MIKKLFTIVIAVAALYGLYKVALWGYTEFMDYSTIERGKQSAIVWTETA